MRISEVKTVIGVTHQLFNHFTNDGQVQVCDIFLALKKIKKITIILRTLQVLVPRLFGGKNVARQQADVKAFRVLVPFYESNLEVPAIVLFCDYVARKLNCIVF